MSDKRYFRIYVTVHISVLCFFLLFFFLELFDVSRYIFICPLHTFFHLYCPTCGGTRAFYLLLSGRVFLSLQYNPVTLLLILLAFYYEIPALLTLFTRNMQYIRQVKLWPIAIPFAVALRYCVVRNILLVQGIWDPIGDCLPYWR